MAAARRLWRTLVQALYDSRQGLFMGGKVAGGELIPSMTFAVAPTVALGLLDAADPIELINPARQALERYSAEQLDAWTAAPYTLQPYTGVKEVELVASLQLDGQALPAIWRRENTIATSFQLLAQIVHGHTVEPLAEPFAAFRSGDTIALEYLLLHVLGRALAERPPRAITVAPWPWGARYALTIRHDVDRVLDRQQFSRLLEFERRHGLGVSWFWLSDRLEPEQLAALDRAPGHEVALHAVRIDQKPRELARVGRTVATPIAGEAIHGAGDAWLGHLTVRAAIEAGLIYTELAPPIADCPYAGYPWVDADGRVGAERIIGITYNISIEGKLGVTPGSEGGPGIYRQLLNHPDLNFDRLTGWIAALPDEPHIAWTCAQLARWWGATHVAGALTIRHIDSEPDRLQFVIEASDAVEDLELRIPCSAATVSEVTVNGAPAEWGELGEPEHAGIRVRLTLTARAPGAVVVRSARSRSLGRSQAGAARATLR
jgi:hypothetical protein